MTIKKYAYGKWTGLDSEKNTIVDHIRDSEQYFATDTNKLYEKFNGVWILISGDGSFTCIDIIDGGGPAGLPPCT